MNTHICVRHSRAPKNCILSAYCDPNSQGKHLPSPEQSSATWCSPAHCAFFITIVFHLCLKPFWMLNPSLAHYSMVSILLYWPFSAYQHAWVWGGFNAHFARNPPSYLVVTVFSWLRSWVIDCKGHWQSLSFFFLLIEGSSITLYHWDTLLLAILGHWGILFPVPTYILYFQILLLLCSPPLFSQYILQALFQVPESKINNYPSPSSTRKVPFCKEK